MKKNVFFLSLHKSLIRKKSLFSKFSTDFPEYSIYFREIITIQFSIWAEWITDSETRSLWTTHYTIFFSTHATVSIRVFLTFMKFTRMPRFEKPFDQTIYPKKVLNSAFLKTARNRDQLRGWPKLTKIVGYLTFRYLFHYSWENILTVHFHLCKKEIKTSLNSLIRMSTSK